LRVKGRPRVACTGRPASLVGGVLALYHSSVISYPQKMRSTIGIEVRDLCIGNQVFREIVFARKTGSVVI
jgi:hypothetical protein